MTVGRHQFRKIVGDELEVMCWCMEEIVMVPKRLVNAVKTLSCGRPGCEEPET